MPDGWCCWLRLIPASFRVTLEFYIIGVDQYKGATFVFTSGFVSLVGRPSVGKSTLLNACYGGKIAITSRVAQTTRRRMRAVLTDDNSQIVIVDTPGLHKPKDALGKELNQTALAELKDVDVVAHLIDASQEVGRGDAWVAHHIQQSCAPFKLLVITKADKVDAATVTKQLEAASKLANYDETLVVSARKNFNVDTFLQIVRKHLPAGPYWFPADMDVDMSDKDLIAEFIREKVLNLTRDEIPHSVAVDVSEFEWHHHDVCAIRAQIIVEREGQKAIIIGKRGALIKKIGVEARKDIEKLLGARVFLDLVVCVVPLWRKDASEIKKLGYVHQD